MYTGMLPEEVGKKAAVVQDDLRGSKEAEKRPRPRPKKARRRDVLEVAPTEVVEDTGPKEDDGLLVELLVAADKYMVTGLRSLCLNRLEARLAAAPSVLKLVDVLRAGYLLDCKPLRQVGLDYLRKRKDRVVKSPEWQQFAQENRTVAAEAFYDAFVNV
jgi:hypothetical protein